MADFTVEQLLAGADNAIKAGNLAAAKQLMDEAKRLSPIADTGLMTQGVSGLNEGVANFFGTPVNIVNEGLKLVGAGSDYPIGGSESLKDLMQTISGGAAISDVPPRTTAQRVVRRGAQEVGTAVPTAAALVLSAPAATATAAPTLLNAGRELWSSAKAAFQGAPGKFMGQEAAAAAGGGAAAGLVAEAFPDNPTAETIAQLVGGLGGSLTANTLERLAARLPAGPKTPADLKSAAGDLYDDLRQTQMAFPASTFGDVATAARGIAKEQGILLPNGQLDPDYPKVQGALNLLDLYAAGTVIDPAQILATRQGLASRAKDAAGTSEGVVLRRMLSEFDAQTSQLTPQIAVANAMYQRAMKGEALTDLLAIAEVNAGQYSQGGMENAIRGQFRELSRKIIRGQEPGWTPDEIAAINQIAAGGTLDNALRFVGKFAPRGPVSASTGMGTAFAATMAATRDPYIAGAAAGALGGTAMGANLAAGALQKQAVNDLIENMLSGRPLSDKGKERMRTALATYMTGVGVQNAAQPGNGQNQR